MVLDPDASVVGADDLAADGEAQPGTAVATAGGVTTIELRPGVSFVARPGWRGEWHVRETVRKIYVIWRVD